MNHKFITLKTWFVMFFASIVPCNGFFRALRYRSQIPPTPLFHGSRLSRSISDATEIISKSFQSYKTPKVDRELKLNDSSLHEPNAILTFDRPNATTTYKYFGFDFESLVTKIISWSSRISRPSVVSIIYKGVGGGKSHFINELRNEFMRRDDTSSMMITFSGIWNHIYSLNYPNMSHKDKIFYEVAYRILMSLHGILPNDTLAEEEFYKCSQKIIAYEARRYQTLFQAVIKYSILQNQSKKPILKYFILLMDDTMIPYEILNINNSEDIYDQLNRAFLNEIIIDNIETSIVISSTKYPLLQYKPPNDQVLHRISLPTILNHNDIVNKWWLYNLPIQNFNITKKGKNRLKALAKVVGRLPKLIETTELFLKTKISDYYMKYGTKSKRFKIDDEFVSEWLQCIYNTWLTTYRKDSTVELFPTPYQLKALLYEDCIPLDESIRNCIEYSMFTNSVISIHENSIILLESSLFCLYAAAIAENSKVLNSTKNNAYMIKDTKSLIIDSFKIAYECIISDSGHDNYMNNMINKISGIWLTLRLQALIECNIDTIPVSILLGIREYYTIPISELTGYSKLKCQSVYQINDRNSDMIIPNLYTHQDEFIQYFNDFENKYNQILTNQVWILYTTKGSPFDILLIYNDEKKKQRFLFLNFKSYRDSKRDKKYSLKEAQYIHTILETLRHSNQATSTLCQSLIQGDNYIYIYMSSYKKRPAWDYKPYTDMTLRTVVTYDDDVKRFLNVASDLFSPNEC